MYNILPFIEQEALHQMGAGQSNFKKLAAASKRMMVPITIYYCPSRREAKAYPLLHSNDLRNAAIPPVWGRNDYAMCGGDLAQGTKGPDTLLAGDSGSYAWADNVVKRNGVNHVKSQVKIREITDGASKTIMIGELYLRPEIYETGEGEGNDQGAFIGYDFNVNRWVGEGRGLIMDTPGFESYKHFGSAHAGVVHFAFCDGSIQVLDEDIDLETLRRLGVRDDSELLEYNE